VRLPAPGSHDQDVTDAREALAFWQRRQANLAWHRRAARREAREHIARWHGHLRNAQLERFGIAPTHPLAPFVGWLALPRGAQARGVGALLMRTPVARRAWRLLVIVAAVTALLLAVMVATEIHVI
jgi:hypothetical protein